ncbi:hypothetical protein LJC26_08040, partial [Desulfovibrio sp. OttesenSCG-928-O18]|nr:hypothetical protein [Desulfovibrio sp. OttesenSCG-928-O18]
TCPTGALVFGKREELLRLARQRIAKSPGKYVDHIYGEKEMGGTNWLYLSPVPHAELGQPEVGTTSVPELTAGALGAVPMVAGLWPVFLGGAYAISKRREKVAAEEQANAVSDAVKTAEEKAAASLEAALAKAEKEKETALENAAKEQETALAAKDEESAAAIAKIQEEAAAKIAKAEKATAKTKAASGTARAPAKKAAKAPAKPPKVSPDKKEP